MDNRRAHLGVYDTLTDSEVGHLLVELHTGRFTRTRFDVIAVAEANRPITTMGGLRIAPDMLLDDLDPISSDVLILPGAEFWNAGGGEAFAAAAARFLDERDHTSSAREYLAATGYAGGSHYIDERAVVDGDLITAGPQSPVQFA